MSHFNSSAEKQRRARQLASANKRRGLIKHDRNKAKRVMKCIKCGEDLPGQAVGLCENCQI